MSGVLVIEANESGHCFIMAKDQHPRPSQQMIVEHASVSHLRLVRQKAAVLGQILGVEIIDTTK